MPPDHNLIIFNNVQIVTSYCMKLLRIGFTLIIGFCFSIPFSRAQKITLSTTSINSNNGLSQNSVQCILKDKYGFMWFGTQDGLNKYDGLNFTAYKNSKSTPASIAGNMINTICEDANGNVWAGTRLMGVSRYDRLHDSFVSYKNSIQDPASLSNDNVKVVYKDNKANLWIGTADGLNLFNSKTGKFKRYLTSSLAQGYSDITAVFEDEKHHFWIGSQNGLILLDVNSGKFIRFSEKKKSPYGNNNQITAILEDDDKNIWIGTKNGLNLVDRKQQSYSYYPIEPDENLAGNINSIFCLAKAKHNKFWIGSNTTLQLFDAGKRKLIHVSDKTNGESMMPDCGISSLMEDNAGILWIGTTSEGVFKYDRNLSIFPAYRASLNNNPSAINVIRSITEDYKRNLYLGTDKGLQYFDISKGTYGYYKHDATNSYSLSNNYVVTVLASKKNNLVWIGTYDSGLDCLDPRTGKFKHYAIGHQPGQLEGKSIYGLFEDKKGNIWFSPEDGGVYEIRQSDKKMLRYLHQKNNSNSICDNTMQAFYEDHEGNIWMGGYNFGISIYNPEKHSFTHINTRNSKLTSDVISAFYEDKLGNMWIGTMDGGLNQYIINKQDFVAYTEKEGAIDNTINYIAGDSGGNIWISTIHGIFRLNPVTKRFKNYGYHNGLKSLEFNLGTGAALSNGRIAFGNINGFNIVDPKQLHFNNNKPVVAITGFELFNKRIVPGAKDSPLMQSISSTKEIKLNHSQSMFSIDFAALDYTIPENNTYAYKLDGFDNEWRYVGYERKATYTNLDPGEYIFNVKAANENGIWNEKETKIKITIVPPYWMTWWFRLISASVIVCAVYLFLLHKNSAERKQKIELENQVEIRTVEIGKQASDLLTLNNELQHQKAEIVLQSKELQEQTNSLEALLQELTRQKDHEKQARLMAEAARKEADQANLAKSTFLATMSHEIRTPLNGVLGMAALLAETKQTREQRDYNESIIKSGDSLLMVINDILDFSKIESGNLKLEPHQFSVRRCLEDVFKLFSYKATESGVCLHYQIDESIPQFLIADSLRLRQVLTNLVGNAMKFTHKGEVVVKIASKCLNHQEFNLYFEVIDTGIGIKEEQLAGLFQAFHQGDSSITRKYGGTGLGLVICQRLIELMGGEVSVTSSYGNGSNFKFYIKCSKVTGAAGEVIESVVDHNSVTKNSLFSAEFSVSYPLEILIAEDNQMNQKLILRILSKLGYDVHLANDGTEVLDYLKKKRYDVILMDIQMPNLDGLETTKLIREQYGTYPVITAMTANALSEDKDNCLNAGMDFYVSKPLSIELLKNKLVEVYDKVKSIKAGAAYIQS
ncbi:MAG: response regulator [Sphingobacteriaceae bacterium]|nr:MAG: response regulator [Sphingobacteriaceae bacterium]